MPELPEVETIKRGLAPLIVKRKIERVEVLTEKSFLGKPEDVAGTEVIGLRRKGKALLIDLSNEMTMLIHLRMTGQLIFRSAGSATPTRDTSGDFAAGHPSKNFTDKLPNGQTRVIFVFNMGTLFFNDQRKFGFVKVLPTPDVEQEKFIAELGPEPWDCCTNYLFNMCKRHAKAPIKGVLLDQKVIAGLGNIYADESLYFAKVHPARPAGSVSETEVEQILIGARQVMEASINSGGSTMATYLKPDGTTGDYLELFAKVFRRQGKPCERCGEMIQKTKVVGRGTHFCPKCQKFTGVGE